MRPRSREIPDFENVSAIVPVVTETSSLEVTVDTLVRLAKSELEEILIVTCDRTTDASRAACENMRRTYPDLIRLYEQRRPFLGNAIREGFQVSKGSHVVMMASDLGTDPNTFPLLVQEARRHPNAVITASRWIEKRSFSRYGGLRLFANYVFQAVTRIAFGSRLTDLTFGYRLFPRSLVQRIAWEGERHEFLLETILKPLRLGVTVVEVPTRWMPRSEGNSQNNLWLQAMYFRTVIRCRLARRVRLLNDQPGTDPASA